MEEVASLVEEVSGLIINNGLVPGRQEATVSSEEESTEGVKVGSSEGVKGGSQEEDTVGS